MVHVVNMPKAYLQEECLRRMGIRNQPKDFPNGFRWHGRVWVWPRAEVEAWIVAHTPPAWTIPYIC